MTNNPEAASDSGISSVERLEWDKRYSKSDGLKWSGSPNGSLVAEMKGRPPARALDVGCGEGADAAWLSAQGWSVTAVDVSTVAIERAKQRYVGSAGTLDFQCRDINAEPFSSNRFELVVLAYPALRHPEGVDTITSLLASITLGGELLAIGHDQGRDGGHAHDGDGDGDGDGRFDPDLYVSVDDIRRILPKGYEVVVDEVRDRPNPPEGARHVRDRVFRVRRAMSASSVKG